MAERPQSRARADLFAQFPGLENKLARLPLGDLPTPAERLKGLCPWSGRDDLFIKRDDVSARPYGGNKVRKLEFLLADAQKKGAVRVITSGASGSNHALATALYAVKCGLRATLILFDQPPSPTVRDNLLMDAATGADMVYREGYDSYAGTVAELMQRYREIEHIDPCLIPAGGSSPVGALGYVNAGLELKGQIEAGELPEPRAIYVAMGTMGTAAGLLLGLRLAGLGTKLVAVQVTPEFMADGGKLLALCRQTNELLRELDPSIPDLIGRTGDLVICREYFEPGYGLATDEVKQAVDLIARTDGIQLDTTYTGKAFAAFCADAAKGAAGPLLFWNTKNSRTLPEEMLRQGRERIGKEFGKYMEG